MSIGISSLRITGIEKLKKKYFQWDAGDCIKTTENDTSPLEDGTQQKSSSWYVWIIVYELLCILIFIVSCFLWWPYLIYDVIYLYTNIH